MLTLFDQTCDIRHNAHGKKEFTPVSTTDNITKGTYYLVSIDKMFRREYVRKE